MQIDSDYVIKIFGYCPLTNQQLLNKFIEQGPNSLRTMPGEYVLIIENAHETYIITSPYGVCQYYYTVRKNNFFHGPTPCWFN